MSLDQPGSARLGARRKSILSPVPIRITTSATGSSSTSSRVTVTTTSVGERALETTLETTSKALAMYKERLSNMIQANTELQQLCQDQEKDAVEVMGALRDQMDKKDREVVAFRAVIDQNHALVEKEKQEIHASYARKVEELNGIILDKESSIRLMEQEVAAVKDFKKKRAELMKEIESQKNQMTEMERRFKESMVRMERKYFEEKVRMQKETNRRISELAAKAHHEAIATLDETTKDMYRENVRLVDALKSHMTSTDELTKQNQKLSAHNMQLVHDKEMNDLIVRDKIVTVKNQNQLIRDLETKAVVLEQTLSHVVREFEVERNIIQKKAYKDLDDIKRIAAQLKLNLDRKTQEMRHIKRLALHLVDQRTDVEKFFMDALDHVRREISHERANERKHRIERYTHLARQAITTKNSFRQNYVKSSFGPTSTCNNMNGPETNSKTSCTNLVTKSESDTGQMQISDLTWAEKERILRVLFARMNGLIKDDKKTGNGRPDTSTAQAKAELSSSSTFDSHDSTLLPNQWEDEEDMTHGQDGEVDEQAWNQGEGSPNHSGLSSMEPNTKANELSLQESGAEMSPNDDANESDQLQGTETSLTHTSGQLDVNSRMNVSMHAVPVPEIAFDDRMP